MNMLNSSRIGNSRHDNLPCVTLSEAMWKRLHLFVEVGIAKK